MAFIIPDQILEGLICSFCHKYLSVKPIIVYPNRDVKCGRCAGTEKEKQHGVGVESLYGKITEKCLFKCTNRFDGCRELLTYSQVLEHEKVCLEKIQKCPICYEEMPSFLMIPHFHSNHNDATLESPAFVFNLHYLSKMAGIYILLYQEEDNIFFLYISYSKSENTIKLELVYMGSEKLASNIYHQFTVTSENKEFVITFNSKPSCTNEFFVVDASNMSHLINVKFKVMYKNPKFFTIPENIHSSSIQNSLEIANQNQEVLTITENVNSSSSSINNFLKKPNQRKIQLIYKSPLDCTTEIVEFSSEHNPQCLNCKEICIFSLSRSYAPEYYYSPTHNDFLCFCCFEWLTHRNKIKENHLYVKQSIPSTLQTRFCKWNCGQHYKFSEIAAHEISCQKRNRYYNCPVQDCPIQNIALELMNHLKKDHNYIVFSSWHHLNLKSQVTSFVFLEDQIIHFQIKPQGGSEFDIECKIATNDNKIQLEWKPHVLFFYNNKFTPLKNLPVSIQNFWCVAKVVLVKNE